MTAKAECYYKVTNQFGLGAELINQVLMLTRIIHAFSMNNDDT